MDDSTFFFDATAIREYAKPLSQNSPLILLYTALRVHQLTAPYACPRKTVILLGSESDNDNATSDVSFRTESYSWEAKCGNRKYLYIARD